jgi:hypothetical protein
MTSESRLFTYEVPSPLTTRAAIERRIEEIVAETFARAEKRRLALEELKSVFHTPAERIAAWEKLHGLRLPSDAQHPVLLSIAASTELSLAQVRDEQRVRNLKASDRAQSQTTYG